MTLISNIEITCAKLRGFSGPQYQILVDGLLLNDYLNRHTHSNNFDLLLPPIELMNDQDQATVFKLLDRRNVILPLLVCSDDMDFSCTIVSTFVTEADDLIVWDSFGYGLDMSEFIPAPKLCFVKSNYDSFIHYFKHYIENPYSEFIKDV